MAGSLERCFTRNNTYISPNCALTIPMPTPSTNYIIDANAAGGAGGITAATYSLKATPQGNQANDTRCGTFTLDDKNNRGIVGGTSTWQDCWGR